jgi:ubiquinone/menaquinone biosynthesis C-methylase UbiE
MVLDLGCGQGHWILNAANMWRDTEFVGLDIVDITLPAFETVENVRLVQGDL